MQREEATQPQILDADQARVLERQGLAVVHRHVGREALLERFVVPVRPMPGMHGQDDGIPAGFPVKAQAHPDALAVRSVDRREMRADEQDALHKAGRRRGWSWVLGACFIGRRVHGWDWK